MFSKYNFGVIRVLRRRLGMTMEQLAQKASLTYPTVAALETNKSLPSMKTLDSLAGILQLSASNLLQLAERRMVQIRKAKTITQIGDPKKAEGIDNCIMASFDKIKIIRIIAEKGKVVHYMELHDDCHELCYVLSGKVELTVQDETYQLETDQTVLFDGVLEHSYKMVEDGEVVAIHIPKDARIIEAMMDNFDKKTGRINFVNKS